MPDKVQELQSKWDGWNATLVAPAMRATLNGIMTAPSPVRQSATRQGQVRKCHPERSDASS